MSVFTDLLADYQSQKLFLVQLDLYDLTAGGPVSLYYSNQGFTSEPGDTPSNIHYDARLTRPLDFQRGLSPASWLSGLVTQAGGSIQLNNRDGALDAFTNYVSAGWRVRVWLGRPEFTLSQFGLIADLVADGHDVGVEFVTINLRPPEQVFAVEIQQTRFAGSGGNEGGADVANKLK